MALYGQMRDISMFRFVNRELMQKIISQQVVFYKCNIIETKSNIYGEASTGRVFNQPINLFALIQIGDQTSPIQDNLIGFNWPVTFRFLRDDLVDANLVPQLGDFIMWNDGYWEIDNQVEAQYFVGKDPDYNYLDDNGNNPYETDLGQFGYNLSVICDTHYVPADRVNIINQRL
jgi:hypothetical protein